MIHTLDDNTIAVEVPQDAYNISVSKPYQYFQIHFDLPSDYGVSVSGGRSLMYNDFRGRLNYPVGLEIAYDTSEPDEERASLLVTSIDNWTPVLYHNYNAKGMDFRDVDDNAFKLATMSLNRRLSSHGITGRCIVLTKIKE